MSEKRYPVVVDAYTNKHQPLHCEIDVIWQDAESPQRFCGDNWCTGKCKLPALVIPLDAPENTDRDWFTKASGSQVAHGRFMQVKRVEWNGERILVPEEFREDFLKRYWR